MEGGSEPAAAHKINDDSCNIGKEEDEEKVENDEEFYERIEAPKFVDFTLPDTFRPDDRFWFCARVGCDQKHEEEIDPEEISKNFVLRVMAARSPNIKLRRALNGKSSGMNLKCPLSAPAKPSKSRISRLALISSTSRKLVDSKEKVGPPKLCSTPAAKSKQVAAKYMTTPRRKKSPPTSNSFRSVQNPKPTSGIVPKNRTVAKALVFHSPKKGINVKSSVELHTPLTKICEGMKRLEITSQKKRELGYSSKSAKDLRSNHRKPFAKEATGRRVSFLKGRRVSFLKGKTRSKESLPSQNRKEREAESSRGTKTKTKKKLIEECNSMAGKDSSGIVIDAKLREDSTVNTPRSNGGNGKKEHLPTSETKENFSSTKSTQEEEAVISFEEPASRAEMNSVHNSEKTVEGTDAPRVQALKGEMDDAKEQDNYLKVSSENGGSAKVHASGYQHLEDSGHESGLRDADDKENVLNPDTNRDMNCDSHPSAKKILGRQENLRNKTVGRAIGKNLKDTLVSAAAGPTVMNYKKPKLTNPKPFRLRTDERGILKEANLERKLHGNGLQKNGNHPIEQSKCNDEMLDVGRKESERSHLKDESGRTPCHRVSRTKNREPKSITSPLGNEKVNFTQKSVNSLTRTRLPYLQREVVRPQGATSNRKAASYIRPGLQLSIINETSKITNPVKVGMVDGNGKIGAKTAIGSSASRSTSRGKRPVTIPKEPNFHISHVPKSCTKNVA